MKAVSKSCCGVDGDLHFIVGQAMATTSCTFRADSKGMQHVVQGYQHLDGDSLDVEEPAGGADKRECSEVQRGQLASRVMTGGR